MKRISILLGFLLITMVINSQTITLPTNKTKVDSALFKLTYNRDTEGSWFGYPPDYKPVQNNGNSTWKVNVNKWNPDKAELDLILNNGGSVNDCELVIRIPQANIENLVSSELPDTAIIGNSGLEKRRYNSWFSSKAKWVYNSYVYVLTRNHTGHILTGQEIKSILNISGQLILMGQNNAEFKQAQQYGTLD